MRKKLTIEPSKESQIEKVLYDDDKTLNNVEYYGFAILGTATSEAHWRILRISYTGNDFVLEWASDGGYTAEWDNRATTEVYT